MTPVFVLLLTNDFDQISEDHAALKIAAQVRNEWSASLPQLGVHPRHVRLQKGEVSTTPPTQWGKLFSSYTDADVICTVYMKLFWKG